MSAAILDINDSNLRLWDGEQSLHSPGYALLEGQQYRFGLEARAAARLRPRDINSRYWWQLNTEELQPALGPARHTADLVHAHLLDIHEQAGQPQELILAVSSAMQREQLALLLGIIEQCPFDAVGLVNRSVALSSLYGGSGRVYHLEIQLQQAVISELKSDNGVVKLQTVFPLPGHGLLQLHDRIVEIIGSAFIRQTRFDPRRKADTEQQLYDRLPKLLHALVNDGEYDLDIAGYRARLSRKDLTDAVKPLLAGISGVIGTPGPEDHVLLDPVAATLPGFSVQFHNSQHLSDSNLPEAIAQHLDQLVQGEQTLNFITALPILVPQTDDTVEIMVIPERPVKPTHLMHGGCAYPLLVDGTRVDAQCELYFLDDIWQLRGDGLHSMQVNGVNYSPGQALFRGDSLDSADGYNALLIEVLDGIRS